jgi:predicted dehydrogenase
VSRSYGPGRYDAAYEGRGLDYPIGYVRWTVNRNLACFLNLVARGDVRVRQMISRRVALDDAPDAYRALVEEPATTIAVVLTYPGHAARPAPAPLRRTAPSARPDRLRVGVIGCGSFVTQQLLPHFKALDAELYGVANRTSSAFAVLEARFHPKVLTTSMDVLMDEAAVDAFIVGTRHDLHAPIAERLVRAGRPVHVEKPMAMSVADAEALVSAVREARCLLTVGYNRRFAPAVLALRGMVGESGAPRQFLYRVNAVPVPPGHWTLDPVQGGGRLIGEGCHFIDLICYLADSEVTGVTGSFIGGGNLLASPRDNFAITMRFANGDVGTVVYSGQGGSGLAKERLEVFSAGRSFVLEDFRRVDAYGVRIPPVIVERGDKGFRGHLENFFAAVRGSASLRTTAEDGLRVARVIEAAALMGGG